MRFVAKVFLGTAILGGLVGMYIADGYFATKKELQQEKNAVALYFENKDCVRFAMQNGYDTFVFERDDFESPWRMTSPKNVVADQDAVNSMLVLIRNISVQRAVRAQNKLANYGLDNPTVYFEITLSDETTKTLSFGKNLNEDSESGFVGLPSVYAQVSGRENILVVDNSSLPSFNEKKYADLRTKQIGYFKPADVASFSITTQNDTIDLMQKENLWVATAPQPTMADQAFVAKYVQMFRELTAEEVLEADGVGPAVKPRDDNATIVFKDKNGTPLQELSLYMSKNGLFVSMPDGAYAKIDLAQWPELVPKFKYFRNRTVLLDANYSNCSGDLTNLVADDIIDHATQADLAKFGLQKPLKTISCQNKNEKDSKTLDIFIGHRVPLDEKNVYLKRSDTNTVYIVNAESLSMLAQSK